jgi:phytoene dehydrogenase-like protein
MVNAPANVGQDWDALLARVRRDVIRKLERQLGEPVASHIVAEQLLDPRGIEQRTSSYQGALYGASSNSKWSAFLRHPNASARIRSLYFCGGSVHPGGGIPLCLNSARIASECIREDYGLGGQR